MREQVKLIESAAFENPWRVSDIATGFRAVFLSSKKSRINDSTISSLTPRTFSR
jgi:hypothetical protein